jgi:hypothetical protein
MLHLRIYFMFRRCLFAGFAIVGLLLSVPGCSDGKPTKPPESKFKDPPPPNPKPGGKAG